MVVTNEYLNALLNYEICEEPRDGVKGKNGNYVWNLKNPFRG